MFSEDEVKEAEQHNHSDGHGHGPRDRHIEEDSNTSDTQLHNREDRSTEEHASNAVPPLHSPESSPHHPQTQSDHSSPSPSQTFGVGEPLPPLHTPHRKRKTILWVGLLLVTLDLACLPITYYYALNFGTDLSLQDGKIIFTSRSCYSNRNWF